MVEVGEGYGDDETGEREGRQVAKDAAWSVAVYVV